MKQIAQNYRSGELTLLDVPVPRCRPGGVLVRTAYSVISTGTELMKISESKLSLFGKARARPDQLKKVIRSVQQQGLVATYQKVMNRLDSFTPLGYSLAGTIIEVGDGADQFHVGQRVACAGNQFAFHAEYTWVPINLCAAIPSNVGLDQASLTTVGAIALQGMRQAELSFGETACVIGLGLLGQILVRLLHAAGVSVIGIDLIADRCRKAEAGGASVCAVPGTAEFGNLLHEAAERTRGHGIDCIFITAGGDDNTPAELAAELARDRARVVDIGKCKLDLPWNAYYQKELDVRFSRSYGPGRYDPVYEEGGVDYPIGYVRWTELRNIECILAMLGESRLDFSSLITDVFPFESAVNVYERMNHGELSGLAVLFKYQQNAPVARRVSSQPQARQTIGKVRVGVIGAGNYASSMLLPHLVADPDVELIEVVTNTALSAANAAKKFGFLRSATDQTELLAAGDIDVILIATRHASHAALVCAALRAGKAVFVEKPLAITRESLAEVVRTVEETGNDRLMVGLNRRFSPLLSRLKREWGKRTGRHTLQYRVNAGSLEKGSWYLQADEGSRFAGEGAHFIDTVSWWLGADPTQIVAAATFGNPDNLTATLLYPDGSLATISYLTEGDPNAPKERIEIFGDGKVACFDNFQRFELWSGGRATRRRVWRLDKGQKAELKAFIAATKTGGNMPINFSSLATTTAVTLAAQESISANRPIAIDHLTGSAAAADVGIR